MRQLFIVRRSTCCRSASLWPAFDLDRLEMGKPVPVVHGVSIGTGFFAYYSLTSDGTLLYLPASQTNQRHRLVWVDRSGREPGPAIGVEGPFIGHPRLSPDGQTIAFEYDWDVALRTLATSTTTQLTSHTETSAGGNGWYANPQWATNEMLTMGGLSIGLTWHLYRYARDRPGVEHALLPGQSGITESLSRPGGRGLVFVVQSRERGAIRYTTSDTSTTSVSFIDPTTDQHGIALSPDGNSLAYVADRQVWVSAFPGGGAWLQVSQNGGSEPRWSHDGTRLFYRALDSLFAADIRRTPRLGVGARTSLFTAHEYASDPRVANYDVAPDDQRFLFVKIVGEENRPKFLVVERNWVGRLRRHVGR